MAGFRIFIAEDDVWYSEILRYHLELNPEYEVKTFDSGKKLIKALHEKPDVVTLDYSLPDTNGKKLLSFIKKESPKTEVVIISGQEDIILKALKASQTGCTAYAEVMLRSASFCLASSTYLVLQKKLIC